MSSGLLVREHGRVLSVKDELRGSTLAQDELTGATTIHLDDVADFDDQGGTLTLDGVTYTWDAVDDDLQTVRLTSGLTGDVVQDTFAAVTPAVSDRWALVRVDDAFDTSEGTYAFVPFGSYASLPVGQRDQEGEEWVTLVKDDNRWVVQDVRADASGFTGGIASTAGHTHMGTGVDSTVLTGLSDSVQAVAIGDDSVAIGEGAQATEWAAVAVGWNTLAENRSTAVGDEATATITEATAVGSLSIAAGNGAVALGFGAEAHAQDAVAIGGSGAYVLNVAQKGIAIIGEVDAPYGIAIGGDFSYAASDESIAIGRSATAGYASGPAPSGIGSIAIGSSAVAGNTPNDYAIAIGYQANGNANYGVSIGYQAYIGASGNDGAVAIGWLATSIAGSATRGALSGQIVATVAIGQYGFADYPGAVAVGGWSHSQSEGSIAIGGSSFAAASTGPFRQLTSAIAIGYYATAYGAYSIAIGDSAQVGDDLGGGDYSIAIGKGAYTNAAHQIMLGTSAEQVYIPGALKIPTGAAAGKVWTSDAAGVGSWQLAGGSGTGQTWATTTKSADYTLTVSDFVVVVDASAASRNMTLPPSTGDGRVFVIKKIDSSTNVVTVTADTTGTADLIDGLAAWTLTTQWDSLMLVASAADKWSVV